MNLRPHHILCIQKFTGHGYNIPFTSHMTSIVSRLADDPTTLITVTQGCDDLCVMCPNNMNDVCSSAEKVALMDSAVLETCGLSYGDRIAWSSLAEKARKQIFETDEFDNICSSCQWYELCSKTEVKNG